jgi:hypothetical protein
MKYSSLNILDPNFKLLAGRPKPDFMLIGAAKSGTTSFSSYLPNHPQIKFCDIKEPNFWSWKLLNRESYQKLFENITPLAEPTNTDIIAGEYSTSSLLHPLVPRRVAGRLPNVKLIVLLRNPIDRAYSHYIMSKRQGLEPQQSFSEIVEQEIKEIPALLESHQRAFLDINYKTDAHRRLLNGQFISVAEHNQSWSKHSLTTENALFRFYGTSYIFRSLYHDQLWRWLQLFPRQQIKIIQAEHFLTHRRDIMMDVVQFLGLKPHEFSESQLQHTWGGGASNHYSPSSYEPIEPTTRELLSKFFKPFNEKLYALLDQEFNWD